MPDSLPHKMRSIANLLEENFCFTFKCIACGKNEEDFLEPKEFDYNIVRAKEAYTRLLFNEGWRNGVFHGSTADKKPEGLICPDCAKSTGTTVEE